MSDFLRHLVERHASRSASRTVRPRAVSRFELPAVERGRGESTDVDRAEASAAAGYQRPLGGRPGHGEAGVKRDSRQPQAGDTQHARGRRHRGDTSGDSLEGAHSSIRDSARHETSTQPRVSSGPLETRPRVVAARDANRHAVDPAPNAQSDTHPASVRRSAVVRPADAVLHPSPKIGRRDIAEGSRTASEPDVVRVHIGRVDVRAVVAAPAERPRAATPAPDGSRALSLSSYLDSKRRP
jgi:hypothetical protein